ncbi:hypothetical protein D3C72_1847460 [compost metagenome]
MQVQRHERIAALLDLADQLLDLVGLQQQLARAHGVRRHVRGGTLQGADVCADQVHLGVAHHDVALLDLHAVGPDGLDFPALQHNPGFVAFFDEVVEKGFLVISDGHAYVVDS